MDDLNIIPLRMIRIAKDLTMEEMAEYFLVTKSYISALEKGKRNINFRTLKYGLDNLGISMDSYNELVDFGKNLTVLDISNQEKYKYMLIKTIGTISSELKEQAEKLLETLDNSITRK